MTTRPIPQKAAATRQWIAVALAWFGGTAGWIAVPLMWQWLEPATRAGGFRAVIGWATLTATCMILLRAVLDMLTDLRDWSYRNRMDPSKDRLTVSDGRIGWAPTILMIWTVVESALALAVVVALIAEAYFGGRMDTVVMLSKSQGESWLEIFGWSSAVLACYSLLLRNANGPLPVPYRWLGLSRFATPREAVELLWPWSRRGP
jgi:hypothetical protein